ncbi:TPA: LysR family transcriptional regulator [Pseudomonas putida]
MTMFLATLDTGSFSAAARALRVPVQTISRNVAELERHLGIQLLTRTTRKIGLTDAGGAYAAAARRIVEQVGEAEREAAGEFMTPRGELVISAPILMGRDHVLPVVSDFLGAFPQINVRLDLRDRNVDLLDDQVDMAVRVGRLPDSGMIATRVGSVREVLCASPDLLSGCGIPAHPQALAELPCIAADGPALMVGWGFRESGSARTFEVMLKPRLVTSAIALVDAAVGGLGFTRLFHYQAHEAIRAGDLQLVLEPFEVEPSPVHLLHAQHRHMPLKMRRFLDFAVPRLRASLDGLATTKA